MANEAVRVEGPYLTRDFTISGVTAVPQGTLMKLSDPRTAVASAVDDDGAVFAGIAGTEKELNDASTELGLDVTGVHLLTAVSEVGAEGAIVAGSSVVISGVNLIRKSLAADLLTGAIIGKAYEDIAVGTTGEVAVGVI